jgi:peptidoglycan/LPS O-acetylase OafA/YrhL
MVEMPTIEKASSETFRSAHYVRGIDTLRLFAALIVAASHGAWPSFKAVFGVPETIYAQAIAGLWGTVFNGTIAVCVFFLISGFCIHYPNALKANINPWSFTAKRITRIGIPLATTIILASYLGKSYTISLDAILWSIYCEIAYYVIYPYLFPAIKARPSIVLLACATASMAVLALYPNTLRPADFGTATFIFCAPLWILGAVLAGRLRGEKAFTPLPPLFFWRSGLIIFSIAGVALLYHSPIRIGLPWTIVVFTPFSYFWLMKELHEGLHRAIIPILERLGTASYSIYLMHEFILTAFSRNLQFLPISAYYIAQIASIAALSALFYWAVEAPAHRLAKRMGRSPARQRARI